MPTMYGRIDQFSVGDNFTETRTVTSVPPGDTLAKCWLTVKQNADDADPGLFQKVITSSFVSGQGQITDVGASGTGVLRFDIQQAESGLLTAGREYIYDIKARTATGLVAVLERGIMQAPFRPVTQATS